MRIIKINVFKAVFLLKHFFLIVYILCACDLVYRCVWRHQCTRQIILSKWRDVVCLARGKCSISQTYFEVRNTRLLWTSGKQSFLYRVLQAAQFPWDYVLFEGVFQKMTVGFPSLAINSTVSSVSAFGFLCADINICFLWSQVLTFDSCPLTLSITSTSSCLLTPWRRPVRHEVKLTSRS